MAHDHDWTSRAVTALFAGLVSALLATLLWRIAAVPAGAPPPPDWSIWAGTTLAAALWFAALSRKR
ncbi:MAG: hypothetical protein R3181_00140 [Rubricoccaceae bacterium]|nr:hypothetical protein [Rubricoccaceae bacterium]